MRSSERTGLLVAAPLGNLADFRIGQRALERVRASSDDLAKRILRFETSRGDIGLRLHQERVSDGDVIYADEALVIALEVAPDDVLVCQPSCIAQAIAVAHALGNRHLPVQVDNDALIVRYDRLVEELFLAIGVAYVRECRTLRAPFRNAHAPHGHP